MKELNEVSIHPDFLDHKAQSRAHLRLDLHESLIDLLKQHHDCFAWLHADMTGIDPKVMVHQLQVDPDYPPVKQKRYKFTPERKNIINEEI